ncbi:MAG: hypothetical protein ACLVJK_07805 [Alistipes putredinis]
MRTLILIPTETEAAPLRAACPDAPVRIAGVGMAAAAAATARIIAEEHPDRLILAGIAGASDRSVAVCEVVAVAGSESPNCPGNTPSAMRPTSFRQDCGPSKAIRPTARESQRPARKLKIWKEPLSWPSAGHSSARRRGAGRVELYRRPAFGLAHRGKCRKISKNNHSNTFGL